MMPNMNAAAALQQSVPTVSLGRAVKQGARRGAVSPELCASSPCLRLPSGRFCVNLPIIGRRCVNIPALGSWRVRCCLGFPGGVSCGIRRC